jgi:hypothetical protein
MRSVKLFAISVTQNIWNLGQKAWNGNVRREQDSDHPFLFWSMFEDPGDPRMREVMYWVNLFGPGETLLCRVSESEAVRGSQLEWTFHWFFPSKTRCLSFHPFARPTAYRYPLHWKMQRKEKERRGMEIIEMYIPKKGSSIRLENHLQVS